MQVSESQELYTLIGLQKYVILQYYKDKDFLVKKILVPHGKVIIKREENRKIIDLTCGELIGPRFFAFIFDNNLRRLKAGLALFGHAACLNIANNRRSFLSNDWNRFKYSEICQLLVL